MLSERQLQDVCLWFSGYKQCRYLRFDDMQMDQCYCIKLRQEERDKADDKVLCHLSECAMKSINPQNQDVPIGDNCSGYPLLKFVEQGYDVD
jgi:hypothetical protein